MSMLLPTAVTHFKLGPSPLQYCLLRGRLSRARAQQESAPAEARAAWFSAGYELLALAVNGKPNPDLVPAAPAGSSKVGVAQCRKGIRQGRCC